MPLEEKKLGREEGLAQRRWKVISSARHRATHYLHAMQFNGWMKQGQNLFLPPPVIMRNDSNEVID